MKQFTSIWRSALCAAVLLSASALHAADAKTYQVTGPVLAVTPTTITVQKGDDKWEIARSKNTKMTSEPKVGTKVTIYYSMVATEIESKEKDKSSQASPKTAK